MSKCGPPSLITTNAATMTGIEIRDKKYKRTDAEQREREKDGREKVKKRKSERYEQSFRKRPDVPGDLTLIYLFSPFVK